MANDASFLHSPRELLVADAKYYAFDVGLQKSVSISKSDDEGRRLENVVAIELIRRGYGVSYLKSEHECDFIASAPGKHKLAVQVCSSEEVPQREIDGLSAGLKVSAKGLLLTKTAVDVKLPKNAVSKTVEAWLFEEPTQK